MYKQFTNAEIAVLLSMEAAALIYSIAEDHKLIKVPLLLRLIVCELCFGYVFFHRSVKLLINAFKNKNNFYGTTAEIADIKKCQTLGDGSYDYYIIKYEYKNKTYTQEIHNSFSITRWQKGDRIKIKVDRDAPDNIIVVFSDLAIAVLMSIIGIIFTAVPIAIYIHFIK